MTEASKAPRDRLPTPPPALVGRRLGRYEILSEVASGGMATVYVGRVQGVAGFERRVAIKILHPHFAQEKEFIDMFLDEARLAAQIRHPNVVSTLDINCTENEGWYIVMEYIEGDHLGAVLQSAAQRGKRLLPPIVLHIVLDALNGLSAAHRLSDERGEPQMLVHRDVSPHNVLVGVDGVARLTDFGVAKAEVRLSTTREGQFKGKLAYMAPEHAATGQADQRADLFSMGVVLWEALTGRRLFRGENNAATLNKILHEPVPLPSSVWAELAPFDSVLARALARPVEDRFQHAEEFIEALEHAASRTGIGVATSRAVAQVVQHYAADKLERESRRIKAAVEMLGHADSLQSGPQPREEPSRYSPYPPAPGHPYGERATLEVPTPRVSPPPAAPQAPVHTGRPNLAWWIGGVLLAIAAPIFYLVFAHRGPTPAENPAAAKSGEAKQGVPQAETKAPSTPEPSAGTETPAAKTPVPPSAKGGPKSNAKPEGTKGGAQAGKTRKPESKERKIRRKVRSEERAPSATPSRGNGSGQDILANPYRR